MKSMKSRRRMRGVTLMELVTVVSIVGILSAIAIPSYTNHIRRVNRTDAKRDLIQYALQLEKCFTRGNNYTIKEAGSADPCVALPHTNSQNTYTVSGDIQARQFTLTATPINAQARDTKCNAFTLTQTGVQGVTGTTDAKRCWEGRE
jgi:type IV pilus assembly protein PilE